MTKAEVFDTIERVAVVPAVRVNDAEQARYAGEALVRAGIPIAEITMTVPDGLGVISYLAEMLPELVVGAGTVLDAEMAQRCIGAGAKFLTSPGLVFDVVETAVKNGVLVFPGALTPSEVIAAWKAGADFVKIYPCAQVGGYAYLRTLKVPLPQVPMIASGGVNLQNGMNYLLSGATALGVGGDLIPREALERRHEQQIHELARRYHALVRDTRALKAGERE
jgi:2-dehydro-3-deoxyphosphogluconate aldolase / (4S)-4-hydroxy-2-oxoglutarate aldolase